MRSLVLLLFCFTCWTCVKGSPLTVFQDKLATPIETPLPEFWVTWDEDSPENRKLWDSDYEKFLDTRKRKAKAHERFVNFILPGKGITYSESGYRADRLDIDSVEVTPLQFFIWMSDDRHPWGTVVSRWAGVKNCTVAIKAEDAFVELLSEGLPEKLMDAPPAKINFFAEAKVAANAYDDMRIGKASVDQRRKLLAFIQRYGSK